MLLRAGWTAGRIVNSLGADSVFVFLCRDEIFPGGLLLVSSFSLTKLVALSFLSFLLKGLDVKGMVVRGFVGF